MELICPICNGLSSFIFRCPNCRNQMKSEGRLQDFLEPYSPYLPIGMTENVGDLSNTQCLHIFYCQACNSDKRIVIDKILM